MKKKVLKGLNSMPMPVQDRLIRLLKDLEEDGPQQPQWPHYSKLGQDSYHCHLNYRWVACWKFNNDLKEIEVYYAGSRENAPY